MLLYYSGCYFAQNYKEIFDATTDHYIHLMRFPQNELSCRVGERPYSRTEDLK